VTVPTDLPPQTEPDTWGAARHMYTDLTTGSLLPPLDPAPAGVLLGWHENAYADLPVAVSRHHGEPAVRAEHRTLLLGPIPVLLGAAALDRLATRRARRRLHHADWTAQAATRVVLTEHRALLHTDPHWTDIPYDAIADITADLRLGMITLHPVNTTPIRLIGRWVPLLAVILTHLGWPPGHPSEADLDWLAPLTID
jgi:hypothetical protein